MLGIIAGSGLQRLANLTNVRREIVRTPFGDTSCALTFGDLAGVELVFLNRHGYGHTLAPHQINYRANIWALQKVGVQQICAIGSVGSLMPTIEPGQIIVPEEQLGIQGRGKQGAQDLPKMGETFKDPKTGKMQRWNGTGWDEVK